MKPNHKLTTVSSLRLAAPGMGVALALLFLGGTGCNKFSVTTPEGFVSLKKWRTTHRYKAVSPDNAVISVRTFKHRDKGTLAFWTEILKREMTLRKGYKLQDSKEVRTGNGAPGQRMVFSAQSGKTSYTYAVAVFVTRKWIHVLETAGRSPIYAKHTAAFDAALRSFRPD